MTTSAPLSGAPLMLPAPAKFGVCRTCHKPLSRQNTTGYCRAHVSAFNLSKPEVRARQRAGIKRRHAVDPAFLDALRRRARALGEDPDINARRTQHFKDARYWEKGVIASSKPEVRARAAKRASATRLAWCPPEYRDEYRRLIRSKRIPAAEARQIILSSVAADEERFANSQRRKAKAERARA